MILSSPITMISQNCSYQLSKIAISYSDKKKVVYVGIGLSYFRKIKKGSQN